MVQNEDTSDHGKIDLADDRARAVEEAGRRAGAALRSPAPANGAAAIQAAAHRRRVVRVAAATAGVGVLLVAGLMAIRTDDGSVEQQPADTPPNADSTTPNSTSAPSTIETTNSTSAPSTIETTNSTLAPSTIETTTNPSVPTGSFEVIEAGTLHGSYLPRYSADGSLLAVQSLGENVLIHDAATLTQLRELPCPTSLDYLPEAVGTAPSRGWIWDVAAAARWEADAFTVLTSVSRPLFCGVTVSPDGSRAVSEADVQGDAPEYGRSLLWDTSDGSLVAVIAGLLEGFSTDGSRLVMSNGPSFLILDSSTGAVVRTITDDSPGTVSSPDGSRLLRSRTPTNADGTGVDATIYDMQTLTPVATLSVGSPDEVIGIDDPVFEDPVFDDTNARVAALHGSGVTIWDASTGAELQHLSIELTNGRSVAFSPGGAMIAVRNGGRITIFDSSTGVQLADLELGADALVQEMVFSADGVGLAAQVDTVAEPTVKVWFDGRTDESMTQ